MLEDIVKADKNKLKSVLLKTVGRELSRLSEPCYYPQTKGPVFEMMNAANLNEEDVKEFRDNLYAGRPSLKWLTHRDLTTNFLLMIMIYALEIKNTIIYTSVWDFFIIRYYSNLMYKSIKFCNPDVFRYTLENISMSHLFYREKTIGNALLFLSREGRRKFTQFIEKVDVVGIEKMITEMRTRVSQSVKNFATRYYQAHQEGKAIKTTPEEIELGDEDSTIKLAAPEERGAALVNAIVRDITVYKLIDKKSMDAAATISKINRTIAEKIVKEVTNLKYTDNLKLIYTTYVKSLKDVKNLCHQDFFRHVRSLMAIKRTSEKIYFKNEVTMLLEKILKKLRLYQKYEAYTNQQQFMFKLFMAFYLTLILRYKYC